MISERDFSLSETWLDTKTNRPDQAKGKEKRFISLYGPFHNVSLKQSLLMYVDGALLSRKITLQPLTRLPAAALSLNTGPVSKIVVPSSHLDSQKDVKIGSRLKNT